MANILTELPKTQFSGLDYDNIMEDITNLVLDNPNYNENWEDFLSGNAGRMLVELFAYIADQLATRIDWVVNENFINSATQKESVSRILKLIGYNFRLPEVSIAPVTVTLDRPVGDFVITSPYSAAEGSFSPFSLTAKDKNGTTRTFEALDYDSTNSRFEYKTGVTISTGTSASAILSHTVNFYEGRTVIDEFTASVDNNPIFTLTRTPVTESSIRVYLIEGTGETTTETELLEVNSFLDPEAQKEEDTFGNEYAVPYILNIIGNEEVSIEFGPTSLLPLASRRLRVGDKIRVFYRTGGGIDGNIVKRSINTTKRLSINEVIANVSFSNIFAATGGLNGETIDYAKIYGPLQVRTSNKTVTENDYDILLNSNSTIIKAKSYGNSNLPVTLYNLYNLYIRPLEVWNYIIAAKPGWEDLLPSEYKNFRWMELREENRFNGIYYFRDGIFNDTFTVNNASLNITDSSFDWDDTETDTTFRNYYVIASTENFKDGIFSSGSTINTDFKCKLTVEEIGEEYFYNINLDNYLDENKATNFGLIEGSTPNWRIEEKTQSQYLSTEDISAGVDASTNKYINLGFDGRTVIEDIDLTGSIPTTPAEIVDAINAEFLAHANYNNTDAGTTKGYQELNISVSGSDVTGLPLNTDFYFRVNGEQYTFNTGNVYNEPTFTQLLVLMKDATKYSLTANVTATNTVIENVSSEFIYQIREGMEIAGTSIVAGTLVSDVNILEKTITLDTAASTGAEGQEISIYPFDFTIEGGPPGDIRVTNLQTSPVGPVWLENGENVIAENNLFTNTEFIAATSFTAFEATVSATGISGYQELGINAVINETSGYHTFTETADPGLTGTYYFSVQADGVQVTGGISGNSFPIVVTGLTLSQIATEIQSVFTTESVTEVTCTLDSNDKIRVTSATTSSTSTVLLESPLNLNPNNLVTTLGVDVAVEGEDDADTELLSLTDYNFKINDYQFTITTGAGATTYLGLLALIDAAITESSYTASVIGVSWNEDIRITSDTTGWINLGLSSSGNDLITTLEMVRIVSEEKLTGQVWTAFEDPLGGGDYAHVAKTFNNGTEIYIQIQSPCYGEFSSMVSFTEPTANSLAAVVLGIISFPSINYGIKRVTTVINNNLANFGYVIIENGSTRLRESTETLYVNYLTTDSDEINLGTYYNENFDITDPSWRERASRIYSTSYNSNTGEIDISNSDFLIKVTSEAVEEKSIYSIENTWNFELSSAATVTTVLDPEDQMDGTNYNININIDGVGDVEIDISGDAFTSPPDDYTIQGVADIINGVIQADAAYIAAAVENPLYVSYKFAVVSDIENSIIIRSPINTNDSSITFTAPANNDATDVIFGLTVYSGYSYSYFNTGDYYIEYDTIELTGDFTLGSSDITTITNMTSEEWNKISVGTRILPVTGAISEAFITAFDQSSATITMNITSSSTINDASVKMSRDFMIMKRVINASTTSNIPDGRFYIHFIFDKRFVEDYFDGSTENGFQSPGFPLGSLDEDIYKEYLETKKIVGITNVFKEAKLSTFDVIATIYYNQVYAPVDVEQRVEASLENTFSLENRDFGQSISRSKIMSIIHDNIGVEYIEMSFLGTDATDSSTNVENILEARFDEIIVLSEDTYLGGEQNHGLIFSYQVSGE